VRLLYCSMVEAALDGTADSDTKAATDNQESITVAVVNDRVRWSRCKKLIATWPRTFSICIGVIIPLSFLILLSLFLGIWLAELEAPGEIETNNWRTRVLFQDETATTLIKKQTGYLPKICLEIFARGLPVEVIRNITRDLVLNQSMTELDVSVITGQFLSAASNTTVSAFNLYTFLDECGGVVADETANLLLTVQESVASAPASLTFHWIRCKEGFEYLERFHAVVGPSDIPSLSFSNQTNAFNTAWRSDQQTIYGILINEIKAMNLTGGDLLDAKNKAFDKSVSEASGGSICEINRSSSGKQHA
jgi:hypothetical protein